MEPWNAEPFVDVGTARLDVRLIMPKISQTPLGRAKYVRRMRVLYLHCYQQYVANKKRDGL